MSRRKLSARKHAPQMHAFAVEHAIPFAVEWSDEARGHCYIIGKGADRVYRSNPLTAWETLRARAAGPTDAPPPNPRIVADKRRKGVAIVRELPPAFLDRAVAVLSDLARAAGKSWELILSIPVVCVACKHATVERYVAGAVDPLDIAPEGWTRDGDRWRCPTCAGGGA